MHTIVVKATVPKCLHSLVCSSLACQNGLSSSIALVATSDGRMHALDLASGSPIASVSAHDRPIEKLAFVPASSVGNTDTAEVACNTVLASSKGGCVRLWDVRSMKPIRQFGTLAHHRGVYASAAAVSACGGLVACGTADPAEIHTYDVRTAGIMQTIKQVC